jgi:hypothetical protein
MATQRLFIIDNHEDVSDGIIKTHNKETIGLAWNSDAPDGKFINCHITNGWVLSEEEYQEYKILKKNEKNNTNH